MRSWLVAAKVRSKCFRSMFAGMAVISWMITSGSALATASPTARPSSPSSSTGSAPASRSPASLPWLRVVAVTWCPAATSCGTRCRPTAPVAPATNTFMVGSFPFVCRRIQNPESRL